MCGSFGDISIFSFYPNKHITTGEGGMLLTNDLDLSERCKKLRNLCFEPNGLRFIHHELGWNYRMTNLQAALGLAQLEQVDHFISKKRAMGALYQEMLSSLKSKSYQFPLAKTAFAENIYWVFGLLAPTQAEKEKIIAYLITHKIGTRPFFWCMHKQPVFQKMGLFKDEKYPVAEQLARNGFYLPSRLGQSSADFETVVNKLKSYYEAI